MFKIPKITIVMPSYNQAEYIDESILSIIGQDYSNMELIVVDGGSTDGSQKIIEKYASEISYWHSRKDKGQTDALIQGFEIATGDILGWINSDDILLPGTFDRIRDNYRTDPDIGIFFGNYILIDQFGNIASCKRVPKSAIGWFASHGHWVFGSTGTFFTRTAYESVSGLNIDLNYVMDADLYIRMLLNKVKSKHVGGYVGAFRRHEGAKTVDGLLDSRIEHINAAQKYWPESVARGRTQVRWNYLYKLLQLINGNALMFLETALYNQKNWKLLPANREVTRGK